MRTQLLGVHRMFLVVGTGVTFCAALLAAQTVTTTSLALSQSKVAAGTVLQLTATVAAGTQSVSPGQVLFYDGKTLLGIAQLLSSGTAATKLRFGPGDHSLTASFTGTKTYARSSSGAQSLTVTAALDTGTKLSVSGTNPYTLTANVTGPGLPPLSGSVTFSDQTNNMTLGAIALGTATTTHTFQSQGPYATGNTPSATVVGDFNGDGIPDLAAANSGDNTVSVLLGKGDGTFGAQTTYGTGSSPFALAVSDFNGDGIPDLAAADSGDNTVSVLLGKGDGSFQTETAYKIGSNSYSVAVGDFNGDGIPDLASTNLYNNTVSVLLGKGDGTFQAQTTYATGNYPEALAVSDFNGDGIPDLAIGNGLDNTVSVLLGKGDGTFQAQTTYVTGGQPDSAAVGDFNGDGIPDLVFTDIDDNTVSVLLGKGDGSFQAQATYATGAEPVSVAVGDFNGDGIPDLAIANENGSTLSLLPGKGDGTFGAQTTYATGHAPHSVAVGDFNGDGLPDLAVANSGIDNTVGVLLNSITQTASATLSDARIVGTGVHSLVARYPATSVYAASSGTASVQAAPLTTALTLSAPGTAVTGATVHLVAILSPAADGSLTANGESITFSDGSTVLGSASLANGAATLDVAFSSTGPHLLQASYPGDVNFAAAPSNQATVIVTQAAAFTITPTPNAETIKRGVIGGFLLTLKSVNGFQGPVRLSCSGGPAGSYCVNLPQTVPLNGTAYAISGILFPPHSTPGTYVITFTGTSGSVSVTATAKFTVE